MSYRVILTANAKGDLRTYYRRAAEHAPVSALRWLSRFEAALATLAVNPQRCSLAPENDAVDEEISSSCLESAAPACSGHCSRSPMVKSACCIFGEP